MHVSPGRFAALRLRPGDDLLDGLRAGRDAMAAAAVAVVTCVGSLATARIRHAGRDEATSCDGPFEIVSLVGTVDPAHQHLHIGLADGEGRVRGGHLLPGSTIYTTAEVVLVALDALRFDRAPCPLSGYRELVVRAAGGDDPPRG